MLGLPNFSSIYKALRHRFPGEEQLEMLNRNPEKDNVSKQDFPRLPGTTGDLEWVGRVNLASESRLRREPGVASPATSAN